MCSIFAKRETVLSYQIIFLKDLPMSSCLGSPKMSWIIKKCRLKIKFMFWQMHSTHQYQKDLITSKKTLNLTWSLDWLLRTPLLMSGSMSWEKTIMVLLTSYLLSNQLERLATQWLASFQWGSLTSFKVHTLNLATWMTTCGMASYRIKIYLMLLTLMLVILFRAIILSPRQTLSMASLTRLDLHIEHRE